MKFACETCSTKYLIPDERVMGRVLRVRCKRCRAVMEVVGPTRPTKAEKLTAMREQDVARDRPLFSARRPADPFAAASGSGAWSMGASEEVSGGSQRMLSMRSQAQVVPPPPASDAIWYVAIKGEPRGPFTLEEVGVLGARGKIHSKSRVWRAGMPAWTRLRDVEELSHVKAPERATTSEMTPAMGSSLPPPLPEMAPVTPQGKPFTNLLSSQPPPFPTPPTDAELTPPPNGAPGTGGTGWYLLTEADERELFEEVPAHVLTTPLQTGSHVIRQPTHRLLYAAIGLSLLAAVMLGLSLVPLLLPSGDEHAVLVQTRVHTPVSTQVVHTQATDEQMAQIKSLGIPDAPAVQPVEPVAEKPDPARKDRTMKRLKGALSESAQQLLSGAAD